jgi:hypothetical protein
MGNEQPKDPCCGASGPAVDPAEVCTLPSDDLRERLAWISREILPHVTGVTRLDDGLRLDLKAAPGLAQTLDHWIALERECCSGIQYQRVADPSPDRLRLEIRGVDPEASIFAPLAGSR